MSLGDVVDKLVNPDIELKPPLLSKLSALFSDDQQEFRDAWPGISAPRRLHIVESVVELAEDNIAFDFVPVLCCALKDDDAQVRAAAAVGLWETDDRLVIAPLLAMLEADESREARAAAATALAHFVDLAEDGKLIERDAARLRKALFRALENENEEPLVRRRSLEAIAPVADSGVAGWVRWAYASGDPGFRQSALYAMGRTCAATWLPFVIDEMRSVDPAMRYEAANAARSIAEPESLPTLHELVSDDDAQVAVAAVMAIGGIGGSTARKLLRQYVETGENIVSEAAEEALAGLDNDDAAFTMLALPQEDE